jgi:hypothetical protein
LVVRRGQASLADGRVVIVDWDIRSLAQGGVSPWLELSAN